jgi:hypothetical protein
MAEFSHAGDLITFKSREVESAICRKGFKRSNTDHKRFVFYVDDKETRIHTKLSHGSGSEDIGRPLMKAMSKQLNLSNDEFEKFIECTFTEAMYAERYRNELKKS